MILELGKALPSVDSYLVLAIRMHERKPVLEIFDTAAKCIEGHVRVRLQRRERVAQIGQCAVQKSGVRLNPF